VAGDRIEKVRYIGMNAPELHHPTKGVEPLAREAIEANRKLVQGQMVRLELDVQERDRYGRLLAYVYVGNTTMINAELVAQGYAQIMTIPPNVKHQDEFLKLQRQARALQLGLWKDAGPAPPRSAPSPTAPRTPEQDSPKRDAEATPGGPGVPPQDTRTCPATHPIKGNFTTYSGERCIYHVPGGWIKMYEKAGWILRVETVINDPEEFRVRRRVRRRGRRRTEWVPLRTSVAYLFRYRDVAQQSNARYLNALAQVEDPTPGLRGLDTITTRKSPAGGRTVKAFNPVADPTTSSLSPS
jgi:nuclease-like protein